MTTQEKELVNLLLEYEILSSWWAWMVPEIGANYYAWKVMRKCNRMKSFKKQMEQQP